MIDSKNKAFSSIEWFRKRYLADDPPEPELVESYETYMLSRRQLHEGMVKVIQRTGRTLEVTMDIWLAGTGSNS